MTNQDLDEVMIIENESFALPWSRESYEAELENQYANYLVCDCAGEVAAFAGMWTVYEEAHITNVAVGKEFRCQGMGRNLMLEEEKLARSKKAERIILEVRPSNSAALTMYQGLGYIFTSIRKQYYSNNQEDALIMTKYLVGS
jgi:ribosomal-protein-alanine N-acetyltransferase